MMYCVCHQGEVPWNSLSQSPTTKKNRRFALSPFVTLFNQHLLRAIVWDVIDFATNKSAPRNTTLTFRRWLTTVKASTKSRGLIENYLFIGSCCTSSVPKCVVVLPHKWHEENPQIEAETQRQGSLRPRQTSWSTMRFMLQLYHYMVTPKNFSWRFSWISLGSASLNFFIHFFLVLVLFPA